MEKLIFLLLFPPVFLMAQDGGVRNLEPPIGKYYLQTAIHFNAGAEANRIQPAQNGFGMKFSGGYVFRRHARLGLGTGLDVYRTKNPFIFAPLFLEVGGEVLRKQSTPVYSVAAGIGFRLNNNNPQWDNWSNRPAGIYLNPKVGYQFRLGDHLRTALMLGYQLQKSKIVRDYSWEEHKNIRIERWTLQRYQIALLVLIN